MIISLIGQDTYLIQQKLRSIITEYKKKHSQLTIQKYSALDEEWLVQLKIFFENQSLFEGTKFAMVSDFKKSTKVLKDGVQLIEKILKNENVFLILVGDGIPTSLSFATKKPALFQEFPLLAGGEFLSFLDHEIKVRALQLSKEDISLLLKIYEGDTWGLVSELDRLELGGKMATDFIDHKNFWQRIGQFLKSPSKTERLALLEILLDHFEAREIFNMMAASKFISSAKKEQFARYDIFVKSGKLDYEECLIGMAIS